MTVVQIARKWSLVAAAICLLNATTSRCAALQEGTGRAPQSDWIQIESGSGRTLRTYVARPSEGDVTRAVVVLHENRGLTSWEEGLADRLAAAGFLIVVPDMLSERGPQGGASDAFDSAAAARDAIHALPAELVLADLDATVSFAEGQVPSTRRVIMVGFCWGGSQAFRFAAHEPRLAAVINFYGAAPHEEFLAHLCVPVYGFYGELDGQITGDVSRLKNRLKALSKDYAPIIYPGASHGFMRTGKAPDAGPANRKAHDDAWARLAELLATL